MNTVNSSWGNGGRSHQTLMELYIGPHAEKYMFAQARLSSPPRKIYWNWAAALGGPVWLFYRKLFRWLLLWLLIGVPLDFIYFAAPALDFLSGHPLMSWFHDYYITLSILYVVVTNIMLGCWGTYLYLQQSERIVELVKAKAPASIAAAIVAEKGNPSSWRWLGGLVLIGGIYGTTYLLAQLWQTNGFII